MASIKDNANKLYKFLSLYKEPVPENTILESLNFSRSTFFRAKAKLNAMNIKVEAHHLTYMLSDNNQAFKEFGGDLLEQQDLISVLHAIKLLQQVNEEYQTNLFIQPLLNRLYGLFPNGYDSKFEFIEDIQDDSHLVSRKTFNLVFASISTGKRMLITCLNKEEQDASKTSIEISIQKMLHYKNDWLFVAFVHKENELRMFSFDDIIAVEQLDKDSVELPEAEVEQFKINQLKKMMSNEG